MGILTWIFIWNWFLEHDIVLTVNDLHGHQTSFQQSTVDGGHGGLEVSHRRCVADRAADTVPCTQLDNSFQLEQQGIN